ncbi:hypothetical protein MJ258_17380 [Legionella sp. EUR-108]|nr:hypothetical protein [Legionella maioricensis]MCL9689291.1 hypothetical protein [Legionella maioricensis]
MFFNNSVYVKKPELKIDAMKYFLSDILKVYVTDQKIIDQYTNRGDKLNTVSDYALLVRFLITDQFSSRAKIAKGIEIAKLLSMYDIKQGGMAFYLLAIHVIGRDDVSQHDIDFAKELVKKSIEICSDLKSDCDIVEQMISQTKAKI